MNSDTIYDTLFEFVAEKELDMNNPKNWPAFVKALGVDL